MSKITGKTIKFESISDDDWMQKVRNLGSPEHIVQLILSLRYAIDKGELALLIDYVEKITEKPPEDLESYFKRIYNS